MNKVEMDILSSYLTPCLPFAKRTLARFFVVSFLYLRLFGIPLISNKPDEGTRKVVSQEK